MRQVAGLLMLTLLLSAGGASAAEVSLFNGLPHRLEVVRLLADGGEQRPWSGPMEPGSRWRLRLPAGTLMEFRRDGRPLARLVVGPESPQGHVIRLPGVRGPEPPPPPPGQPSEFPGWRRGTRVCPVPASVTGSVERARATDEGPSRIGQ